MSSSFSFWGGILDDVGVLLWGDGMREDVIVEAKRVEMDGNSEIMVFMVGRAG